MPNIMIHEEVGNYIAKKLNITSYDYYLGLMAPDAPNLEGFAEKEARWTAHQRRKDYNEWKKSIKDFYQKERYKYPRDFIFGYYVHVLTDIVFDDLFYLNVREEILKDGYKKEESHQIMNDDMNKYYFNEIENIKKILSEKEDSYDILNISKERLNKWKIKKITTFQTKRDTKYITDLLMKNLNETVYKEIFKQGII